MCLEQEYRLNPRTKTQKLKKKKKNHSRPNSPANH